MNKTKKYKGVVVPAVTPLTADWKPDEKALEKMFDTFYQSGVSPFILGTTGEASSLSVAAKHAMIKLASKWRRTGTQLYAGIGTNCLQESVELAKVCFDKGVDAVVANLPSYYTLTHDEIKKYFVQLADQVPGPLIIYNIPSTTHMSIPLSIIDELSHHDNIVGTKDSERSEDRLKSSLALWAGRDDFSHFLGWAARSAEALRLGSDGLVPSTGNLQPGLYHELYAAVHDGDMEKSFCLQELSDMVGNLYQKDRLLGESLAALKFLMKEAGLCQPYMMPPLQMLSPEQEDILRKGWREFIDKERMSV